MVTRKDILAWSYKAERLQLVSMAGVLEIKLIDNVPTETESRLAFRDWAQQAPQEEVINPEALELYWAGAPKKGTTMSDMVKNRGGLIFGAALALVVALFIGLAAGGAFNGGGNDADANGNTPVAGASADTDTTDSNGSNSADTGNDNDYDAGTNRGGSAGTDNSSNATCPGDHHVQNGETYVVPAGCNVKGDVSANGTKYYDDDPATGLIVSCPNGCTIDAPWGANVTPRDVNDIEQELRNSGCEGQAGCADVRIVIIDDDKGGSDNSSNSVDCGGELGQGETRLIKAGCIIVGDVVVDGELQKPRGRSTNTVGYVQLLDADTNVEAPWGAGVYESEFWDVNVLVENTKKYGCDQGAGCKSGVYDWSGDRLDQ